MAWTNTNHLPLEAHGEIVTPAQEIEQLARVLVDALYYDCPDEARGCYYTAISTEEIDHAYERLCELLDIDKD